MKQIAHLGKSVTWAMQATVTKSAVISLLGSSLSAPLWRYIHYFFHFEVKTMLTKEFIKALKQADTICLRFSTGHHTIEASKRVNDGVYGDRTASANLVINGIFDDYGKPHLNGQIETCFCYLSTVNYMPHVQTMLSLLRPNDELTAKWVANNDSENLTKAGMACDQVFLQIKRTSKAGKVTWLEFFIDETVTMANSTARTCRRGLPISSNIAA